MSDPLDLELSALGRLAVDLQRLGAPLKRISETPSATATPDGAVDMPSLTAARPVSVQTIKELQGRVANRFIEVGYLVDHARTRFRDAEDNRATVIYGAGSLLQAD